MMFLEPEGFYRMKKPEPATNWKLSTLLCHLKASWCLRSSLQAPLMNLFQPSRNHRVPLLKFLLSSELKAKFGASTDGGVPGG